MEEKVVFPCYDKKQANELGEVRMIMTVSVSVISNYEIKEFYKYDAVMQWTHSGNYHLKYATNGKL